MKVIIGGHLYNTQTDPLILVFEGNEGTGIMQQGGHYCQLPPSNFPGCPETMTYYTENRKPKHGEMTAWINKQLLKHGLIDETPEEKK